jgi:hypothetical protein
MNKIAAIATILTVAGAATAQTIDGTGLTSEYGAPLWVQDTGTGFANNTDPSVEFADGDELNAAYATLSGGILKLGLAGNVSTGFNKLNIVLDYQSGGQQTLSGLANLGNLDGLTLDNGFEADAVISYTAGNDPLETFVDGSLADGTGGFLGGGSAAGTSVTLDGAQIDFGVDNSNLGGINTLGNPFDSAPSSVDTGIEVSIDLAALGYVGGEVKIGAWINGANNDFLSNQVIGGLPTGTGNLGGDGAGNFTGTVGGVDFTQFDGDQFIVIPSPGATGLLALAGLAAVRRRRA